MLSTLRFLRFLSLGAWIGAIVYFAAVVTVGAFRVLPSQDTAGLLVGDTLSGLQLMGLIAAAVFAAASLAISRSPKAFAEPAMLGVILMAVLTIVSQNYVIPRMDVLRGQMMSIQDTPRNDPRHVEFDRLHKISVDLEAGILLVGLASLFLASREKRAIESSPKV
ncbi:MAG TPA: DUF4149 domain-containing protein [Candidatus Baltobacteraceae bacterium]|nr:DUF4149 domain-containing protein [Candidatus Baltobacteraceae bacterium]